MPRLDGVGACKVIKPDQFTEGVLVIMVSARGDRFDQEYAREMGAVGYITKPFIARESRGTVNRLLNPEYE